MSLQKLPSRPSLRHLRLQAKSLLKKCRENDPRALKRLALRGHEEEPTLNRAQRAIARQYDFRSWRGLKEYVDAIDAGYAHQGAPTPEILRQALLLLLDHRHFTVAERLLSAAGGAGLKAIEIGLQHRSVKVRKACAQYLDHHADAESGIALKAALHDPVPGVRAMAVHAIACERCKSTPLDPAILRTAIGMLKDPGPEVRSQTAWTLGFRIDDVEVRTAIVRHLAVETVARPLWLARNALALHARDMFARKTEDQIRKALGAPACVIDANGSLPRILVYDPRALVVRQNSNEGVKGVKQPATGLFHTFQLSSVGPLAPSAGIPRFAVPSWLRIILAKDGAARSISLAESPELRRRKTG